MGALLIAAFFSLGKSTNGTAIHFVTPWDRSNPGELNLWLGWLILLLPGCTLLGLAAAAPLQRLLKSLHAALGRLSPAERWVLFALVYVIAVCVARIGNAFFLRGLPFTDDEYAARFGGQVLALGHLQVPIRPYFHGAPMLFLYALKGRITSMDFPGALVPWTLSEWTGTGTLVFALAAGLFPLGVAIVLSRRHSLRMGLAGAVLAMASPMSALLSFTSHAQVVSRGLLASGLCVFLFLVRPGFGRGLVGGLMLGLAATVRPAEICALTLPLGLGIWKDAVRDRSLRAFALGLTLGAAAGLAVVFIYDYAVAGTFAFLRVAPNEIPHPYGATFHSPLALEWWWPRLGYNVTYNALMLCVFFAGPAGIALAVFGARMDVTHRRLLLGVLLGLCVGLLHDDRGLHAVGPIHYSEAAVPLCILACSGLNRLLIRVREIWGNSSSFEGALLGYTLLGLTVLTVWNAGALREQAMEQEALYSLVESAPVKPAVVLAPHYGALFKSTPAGAQIGTWVFEWRRPRPDGAEPVLLLNDSEQTRAKVARWLPNRAAFTLTADPRTQVLHLKPVVGQNQGAVQEGRRE